jgi:hypothetical protein
MNQGTLPAQPLKSAMREYSVGGTLAALGICGRVALEGEPPHRVVSEAPGIEGLRLLV